MMALPDLLLSLLFAAVWGALAALLRRQGYLVTLAYTLVAFLGFLALDQLARALQLPIPTIGVVHPVEGSVGSAAMLALAWLL